MLFTFAGSGHSNYVSYILEQITWLELESTPEFREFFLKNWLVNPSGRPDGWVEGDIMQEHFNLKIEQGIGHGGQDFGDPFIRDTISRTVHHATRITADMRKGMGLKPRSQKHPKPHTRPEIRNLLAAYKEVDLHLFREGRCYSDGPRDVNDYDRGIKNLGEKKLKAWIQETTRARVIDGEEQLPPPQDEEGDENQEVIPNLDSDTENDELGETSGLTMGHRILRDGELVIETEEEALENTAEEMIFNGNTESESETDDSGGDS